jgi:hypothetical protein
LEKGDNAQVTSCVATPGCPVDVGASTVACSNSMLYGFLSRFEIMAEIREGVGVTSRKETSFGNVVLK